MAQSLAQIYLHLIFSTKDRQRLLTPEIQPELFDYIGGTLNGLECPVARVGGMEDHVHVLFSLSKNHAPKYVVGEVKRKSSIWIKRRWPEMRGFQWQGGYGIFSVSATRVQNVKRYIERQADHHKIKTFREEFIEFLQEYDIDYDERYLWDAEHGL